MRFATLVAITALGFSSPVVAQAPDVGARIAAQREGMKKLSFLDGVWRGPATAMTPTGPHNIVQTERIGSFLDGSVKVIEGRGYEPNGTVSFNALGVISFNPITKAYSIQSWAMGQTGTFPLRVTPDGYVWETPAGPGALIRYTAKITGKDFHEVGERIVGGAPPIKMFEMKLRRVGSTSWPAGDPVPMR
jgi:hypothetical protein